MLQSQLYAVVKAVVRVAASECCCPESSVNAVASECCRPSSSPGNAVSRVECCHQTPAVASECRGPSRRAVVERRRPSCRQVSSLPVHLPLRRSCGGARAPLSESWLGSPARSGGGVAGHVANRPSRLAAISHVRVIASDACTPRYSPVRVIASDAGKGRWEALSSCGAGKGG